MAGTVLAGLGVAAEMAPLLALLDSSLPLFS